MNAAHYQFDSPDDLREEEENPAPASALKLQAAERLAAHRARRGHTAAPQLQKLEPIAAHQETRASRIAAAVSERYAQSQSYHAFLAAEAEKAIHQAEAAAEIAVRTAKAVVASQQQLLSELEHWAPESDAISSPILVETPVGRPEPQVRHAALQPAIQPAIQPAVQPTSIERSTAGLTVRLYEDVGRSAETGIANAVPYDLLHDEERLALDDEIAFRQSPDFQDFLEPATPLPANLIEFPRQLIATRKARPRLAEGPLREESDGPENAQLRIFEVEPDQISTLLFAQPESHLPEWSSIRLSACTTTEAAGQPSGMMHYTPALQTAPLGLRVMASMVDGCLITATFLASLAMFVYMADRIPTGQSAVLGAVGSFAALALIYQLLFFTFSNATPGMLYARIGLCTFADDNPSRSAMRRRIIAILLAACPAGLGLLWAWLDDDRLGWHDRISRMYQRSY